MVLKTISPGYEVQASLILLLLFDRMPFVNLTECTLMPLQIHALMLLLEILIC